MQARNSVWPRRQLVPHADHVVSRSIVQSSDVQLDCDLFQRLTLQYIEYGPFSIACAHALHRWGISHSPTVHEVWPVGGDSARSSPFIEARNQTSSPIHHGAKGI